MVDIKNHEKMMPEMPNNDVKLNLSNFIWVNLRRSRAVQGTKNNDFEWAPAGELVKNLPTGKTEFSIEIDPGARQELRKQCTFEFNSVAYFLALDRKHLEIFPDIVDGRVF